jgi:rubrerythrin
MSFKGSQTEANLQQAFARESQANRRFLYFAEQADIEGFPDAAALLKNVADGETAHAHGHLEFLAVMGSGDPVTGMQVGTTAENLKSALESETFECAEMYPKFAQAARDEQFYDVADWFDNLARAEKLHVGRIQQGLDDLG